MDTFARPCTLLCCRWASMSQSRFVAPFNMIGPQNYLHISIIRYI
jgi:hypothetical protein